MLKETGKWPLYDSWVRYVNEGRRRVRAIKAWEKETGNFFGPKYYHLYHQIVGAES